MSIRSLQPEVYDLQKVKSEFGDKLCFWGGIGTQHLLPFTNPAEIERTVNATLEIMGENGGYIAGPAHAIVRGTPPANVVALINVLKHQQGKRR